MEQIFVFNGKDDEEEIFAIMSADYLFILPKLLFMFFSRAILRFQPRVQCEVLSPLHYPFRLRPL
jgi:hypothetical protein